MVMDPERNMGYSVEQAGKKVRHKNLGPGVKKVAPCFLEKTKTTTCLNRLRGHTCPVKLGIGSAPNKGCAETVSEYYAKD